VKAWIAELSFGGFGVREVSGDNEHWHWLLTTEKTYKAVRVSFNKRVPELKGNGAYSMSEVADLAKYERYLCKGESDGEGPEVIWSNSIEYAPDRLEELHRMYWAENRSYKKRKGSGSMIDYVIDYAKREGVAWNARMALAKIYIKECGMRGKPINLFAIRSNLNTIQYALCPNDDLLDQLVERVEQY